MHEVRRLAPVASVGRQCLVDAILPADRIENRRRVVDLPGIVGRDDVRTHHKRLPPPRAAHPPWSIPTPQPRLILGQRLVPIARMKHEPRRCRTESLPGAQRMELSGIGHAAADARRRLAQRVLDGKLLQVVREGHQPRAGPGVEGVEELVGEVRPVGGHAEFRLPRQQRAVSRKEHPRVCRRADRQPRQRRKAKRGRQRAHTAVGGFEAHGPLRAVVDRQTHDQRQRQGRMPALQRNRGPRALHVDPLHGESPAREHRLADRYVLCLSRGAGQTVQFLNRARLLGQLDFQP